jgi:uncharacterized protein YceK
MKNVVLSLVLAFAVISGAVAVSAVATNPAYADWTATEPEPSMKKLVLSLMLAVALIGCAARRPSAQPA